MNVLNKKMVHNEVDKTTTLGSKSSNRPLSPHLSIYQPQLTWVLSIAFRVTGCGLTVPIYAGAIAYACQDQSIDQITTSINQLGMPVAIFLAAKILLAWPFSLHSLNGIRHLIWDTGRSLSIPGVYTSGKAVIYGSLLTTAILVSL